MFWVVSVYFNIRNTLPKSGTFLLGHPLYIYYIYIYSGRLIVNDKSAAMNIESVVTYFRTRLGVNDGTKKPIKVVKM